MKAIVLSAITVLSIALPQSGWGEGPSRNPYLADVPNNQGHWNDAATDSTDIAVPRGHYRMTPEGYQIVPSDALGIPAYTAMVGDTQVHWFFAGFSMRKLIMEQGRFVEIDRLDLPVSLPGYTALDAGQRLAQARAIRTHLDAADEAGLAEYLRATPNRLASAVEDQVQRGVLYSLFTREHALVGSSARGLIRIDQADSADPYSKLNQPLRVQLPNELFNNERVARNTMFPADVVFGLSMTFNGFLVVNTLGGKIITLNRDSFEIIDVYTAPGADELYTNGFATSEELGGGAVYVASNQAMYRFAVDEQGMISDAPSAGAWRADYDIGVRLPAGKIAAGTGSTPTLMGFGDDSDKLVVITDGARNMRLVAFWRDRIPDGWQPPAGAASRRIADQIRVNFGMQSDVVQSEQSVVVQDDYAFVVNGVESEKAKPYLLRGAFNRALLIGVTRTAPAGAAMYRWDDEADQWRSQWHRSDVGVLATVPFISGASRMVIVDGYYVARKGEAYHLGFDLDSGATVMSIATGSDPLFNGTFTDVKCDLDGALMYTTMFGLVRFEVDKMVRVERPD